MSGNPYFTRALDEMEALHNRKNHDYASDSNPFSNFEHAADASGMTTQQVFDVLLGVKQARLVELTAKGKVPNNESLRDTLLDRAVYATIALAYHDWAVEGRPSMHPGQAVLFDPSPEAEALPSPDPSFLATLDTIDKMMLTAAQRQVILNPHRHLYEPVGPPPAVSEVADFHTEGG
jgi:hypothetical protein